MKSLKKFMVVMLLVCPLLVGCASEKKEEKKKEEENTETSVFKNVTKDNLVYRNSSFEVTENGTTIITEVENVGEDSREITTVVLELKDKDGNIVDTLSSYVGKDIKPNDSEATIAKTEADLSNVTSIDYSVN